MSISASTRKQIFAQNGTGPYTFNFKVLSASHLTVQKLVGTTLTTLTSPADYSVTLTNGGVNGGVITLTSGLTGTNKLIAQGATPRTQDTPYANLGPFSPERHETSYDKLTMLAQELDRDFTTSIRIPTIDQTGTTVLLPVAAARAGKALIFDIDGNVTVSTDDYEDQTAAAAAAVLLAQQWATLTTGIVDSTDYAAKAWAIGGTGVTDTATRGAAKEWATKTGGTVDGTEYSAKHYASIAEGFADDTEADAIATAADVVSTNADVVTVTALVAQAASHAAEGLYVDVVSKTFANSPFVPAVGEEGTLFRIDTSGGNFVVNLSSLATYGEDIKFAFVKVTGDANTITINRGGTDTISGTTSVTLTTQYEVNVLIGDSATGTWLNSVQSAGIADDQVTNAKLANMAQATIKGRASGAGTGDPTDLSAAQVKAILNLQDSDLTFTDITTGNASTSAHGYLKKLPNDANQFMNGLGNWATVSSYGGATETSTGSAVTLTASSNRVQNIAFTSAGLYVKLPNATTLSAAGGPWFIVKNTGSFMFPVIDNANQAIALLAPGEGCILYNSSISTAKGKWYAGRGDQGTLGEILNGVQSNGVTVGSNSGGSVPGCFAYIDGSKFLFCWSDHVATATFKCAVISITNADTLSAGSVATIATAASVTSGGITAVGLDSSNVAVAYHYNSVNNIVVVGISGTTATVGTSTSVVAATSANAHLFKISSTSVFYAYVNSTTSKGVVISSMSTSGNTVNSITTCRASTLTTGELSVSQADVNTYIYATVGSSNYLDHQLVTVSGTTVTANTALANKSLSTVIDQLCTIALSTTLFLTVYQTTANAKLHFIVVRVSTGTTLEVLYGGNATTGNDGAGTYRIATSPQLMTFQIMGNYAVLFGSDAGDGGPPVSFMDFFKFNTDARTVSYSHTVFGQNCNQFFNNGGGVARPALFAVAPGKYATAYSPATGTATPGVYIQHGITNP